MKETRAIILSAGQGRRLNPLTADTPKCLLPVDRGRSVLELQLETLAQCGIRSATVMVGFEAQKVERLLARCPVPQIDVDTRYNPFFEISDNLITCWLARDAMTQDFVLLNGDTLVQPEILRRMLAFHGAPIAVAIDRKDEYVADDMKVSLDATRLHAIGKTIPLPSVDGEAIGLSIFRGDGVRAFRAGLENTVRDPQAFKKWYLYVVDALAGLVPIETVSIEGLWWTEIDSLEDLAKARSDLAQRSRRPSPIAAAASSRVALPGTPLPST